MATVKKKRSRQSLAAPGLTEQQDRFARHLAMGVDVETAWHDAGYRLGPSNIKHSRKRAETLAADPRIKARVADLATEAEPIVRKAIAIGAERLVLDAVQRQHFVRDRLAQIADIAIAERSYNAAMEALDMLGRDAGMWPGQPQDSHGGARRAAQAGAIAGAMAGSVVSGDILAKIEAAKARHYGQRDSPIVDVTPGATADHGSAQAADGE